MFIVSKRNIIIPSPDGKTDFFIPKNYMGSVPKWAEQTAYFCALVNDGKLDVSLSKKDKDIDRAAEIPVTDHAQEEKKKRRKKTEEETEEETEEKTEYDEPIQ